MQSQPDGDLKWVPVYQDYLTKFVHFCPVKPKRAPKIAYQLLDILSMFGGPSILESDKEFVNSAIAKLINMGSGLKKVHEKPRYS